MVYRSISTTHLNSNDVNNVLPIPTINYKSSSFTNLTLPPPPQTTDLDPGKQARRSVRRLSIDIERLRLKKDVTTLCTTKRRNSVCRSVCDLSKSGLYDDLKSLKTRRNECVQKQKSDKIAVVPCTTTTKLTIPAVVNDQPSKSLEKLPSWLGEGLEPEPELEQKNVNSIQCSLPLNRLPVGVVDLLMSMKCNNANDKLKILCLYCDRTFSSQTLYAKHSERVHQAPEGRRLSARKSNSSSLLYPGCSHCHNGKTTSLLIEELPALFHHLIDIHFDKYFACKPCIIRFPTKETLQIHLHQLHEDSKAKIVTTGMHDKRKKRSERRDKQLLWDNNLTDISQPLSIQVDLDETYGDKKEDEKSSSDEPILRSSRRQHANRMEIMKTSNQRKTRMLRNEETILSRLGITQNRSPRTRRGLKSRTEMIRAETPIIRPIRNKNTRSTNNSSGIMVEGIEMTTRSSGITKVETLSSTFDENFYESVNGNVRQNLSCHLDGKLHSGPMSPSPLSPVDPVPTVRSTLVTSPLVADSEIHEATAISALTAFPTLLTASQYGAEPMPAGKIKKPITKNSWKWKWDCVKKYKYVNEGGKVVKKVKQPVAGIRDLSKLDMWTQLTMRTKHELVRKQEIEISGEAPCLAVGEEAREDKRKLIEQLNQILDTRILPQINLEQNDQRIVKLEAIESQSDVEQSADLKPEPYDATDDLPTILQLKRRPAPTNHNEEERVLSGEWARPRCYICYGCGEKFENIRRLEDHKNAHHPHVYSTHYEIVGKELIEGDLFRHFYIPVAALRRQGEHANKLNTNSERKSNLEVEDSMDSITSFSASFSKSDSFDIDSNSRNSKVSAISMSSSVGSIDESSVNDISGVVKKSCTKCERSYNTMADLYRHMLDCSGDYEWFLAKKRHNIKYRYFGSRRRKVNRPNFGNRRPIRPKKEESETPRIRDTQTPKPRPSDAESIQRMLANLPPKRVCRQIFPSLQAKKRVRKFMPVNTLGRNRQQIHLKQSNTKTNRNFKFITTTQTTATAIRKNITRRLRLFSTNNSEMGRNTRSAKAADPVQLPEVIDTVTSPKGCGIVKNITRRTQRVFPKLANSFRRPMQKKGSLRNALNESPKTVAKEAKSSSILERMNFRKSKRVQVTLTKLDGDIVDLMKVDAKPNVESVAEQPDVTENDKSKKTPVRKRTIRRLIKGMQGKRTGKKKLEEKNETEVEEEPLIAVPIEDEELKHIDEIPEKTDVQFIQVDESSQSNNRSCSSKRSKRSSIKKQKIVDTTAAEANPNDKLVENSLLIETNCVLQENKSEESDIQRNVAATSLVSEVPMDLSSNNSSAPIVQQPLKTPPAKRRTRKLNDCIAMLTGKLQEKLGVPFLNSETNILLSPSVPNTASPVAICEKELQVNQKGDVEMVKSVEPEKPQTPTKESTSNHSTPTKRGNRKGRTINFENVSSIDLPKPNEIEVATITTMETINLNVANDAESDKVSITQETIQLVDLVVKETLFSDSDSKSSVKVSEEKDVLVEASIPLIDDLPPLISTDSNLALESVHSLEITPKRSPKHRNSKPTDTVKPGKLSPTTKKVGTGKKSKAIETVLESKTESSPEILPISNETICGATVITSKGKESKKKLLLETIILDTVEPVEMESTTLESFAPKRRQTKNSTEMQSSVNSAVSSASLSPTEEICNVPEPIKSATKSKRGKGSDASKSPVEPTNDENVSKSSKAATKSVRKNRLKDTSSTPSEKTQDPLLQSNSKAAVVDAAKETTKPAKNSKKSKISDAITPSEEAIIPSNKSIAMKNVDFSDDDEMHPWDPEVGFINAKNSESIRDSESISTPVKESPPAPCTESEVPGEPDDIQDRIFKSSNDEITTLPSKTTDSKSGIKKKRRKNELAKIIADQLLESFKEVDKSRIEELKLLHDLSIESNDDLLITTTLSRTPPPKRRTAANIRTEALVDLDTSFEGTNSIEDIEVGDGKTTTKRKKINVDSKKVAQNVKLATKRKVAGQKTTKKDGKKKSDNIDSAGYLSDSEICQPKVPVTMRRRLTICDESPKRMSRNSKETEVSISLFDSIKKPRNVSEPSIKQATNEQKSKMTTKVRKRKNRRNTLQQSNDDQSENSADKNKIQNGFDDEQTMAISSDKFDGNGKEKAAVNDLVAQIINDFTTSTLNSPTTSPIVFGEVTKPVIGLNNAVATKLSSVLNNKKNILNGEILSNGFKNDVSKEITFATLSQPLKNKSIEHIRNTDIISSTNMKPPLRAPFMSPRWEQTEEWNAASKTSDSNVNDPAMHKLWTLNNKDEKLSVEKSLHQNFNDKMKKIFGKISKKKIRKHDGQLMNNKMITPMAIGIKKPLLRPSILSISNVTTKVDMVESENCLKKLESNSLFLGKVSNFENDSISKIFLNEKINSIATEKNLSPDPAVENELFGEKKDVRRTILDNMKSNIDSNNVQSKEKNEKQPRKNVKKGRSASISDKPSSYSSKNLTNNEYNAEIAVAEVNAIEKTSNAISTVLDNESENVVKIVKENIEKTKLTKRRKMGSTKRRSDGAILAEKLPDTSTVSNNLNNAFCEDEQLPVKSAVGKKQVVTKSFDPCCESSQDTIISEIVNKIRVANNDQATESDEDLSLAEIAKNLNNKIFNCDDFSNDVIAVPLELSDSFVDKSDFNNLPERLSSNINVADEAPANCDDKPTKAYTDVDDSEFLNENTNTELIDMDLEDTASVYTSSMETTITTSGGGGGTKKRQRKRRHGRSILMKSNRKSKRSDGDFLTPGESYFCDICSKTFRTQGGLATHRTTLTHISKLSEQEFKLKMEPPKDLQPEPKSTIEEDAATKPDITKSPIIESSSQPQIPLSQSPPSVQRHQPIMSPIRNQSMTYLNNIEPISSPEQHDLNYDRYNTSTPRSRNHLPIHDSTRLALSQEQRFFYECCSMLKGSDRSNVNPSDSPNKYYTLPQRSEIITKPVTPRSNEQYSYVVPEGSKHSKGIPKIDLNQFSDISSDSNPAYSCPQNPSSSETQNIFPIEPKTIAEKDYHSLKMDDYEPMKKDDRTFVARTTVIEREYLETYSDMGDSFPSSQDVSESEQYVQTILERSSNAAGRREESYHDEFNATHSKNAEGDKKRTNLLTMAVESHAIKGFPNSSPIESPLHSTSSQSSTLSKPRTKAAMKGYDNFKVSIPTTGIDLQQALNRSPNPSGCKLAALADIALGNDVPNAVGLVRSTSVIDIETSHTLSVDQIHEPSPVLDVISAAKAQITNKSMGNKLGFNHRKKKIVSTKPAKKLNKSTVKIASSKSLTNIQPRDVYDFEDFDDSADAPILTLSQVRSKPIPPTNIDDDEDSEISSYSDREDYNYESMSESDSSVNNLQKKCLIERIFKSVKKTDVKEKDKLEPKKAIPKQELDKLFDGLRQSDKTAKVEEKKTEVVVSGPNKEKNERSRDRQSKKPREIANLEEEWGMSMNEIVELIGVGQRKTQRRCAANKQKTFAENWSSDEYEDFHATKDIFALIHEAEQKHFERAELKAGRARSRTARSNAKRESQRDTDQVDKIDATNDLKSKQVVAKGSVKDKENKIILEDEKDKPDNMKSSVKDKKSETPKKSHSKSMDSKIPSKKTAKVKKSKSFVGSESDDDNEEEFAVKKVSHPVKTSKIKNRRQTISSRPEINKSTSKSTINGARVKQNRSVDSRDVKGDSKSKLKPMARRKRKASEMLYYWSSSSDEEFGRIKPRDDNFDDDNLEQHGWIVGDSHKKLVTLLAHAKGKKIEDCAVKEAIHKKKS